MIILTLTIHGKRIVHGFFTFTLVEWNLLDAHIKRFNTEDE